MRASIVFPDGTHININEDITLAIGSPIVKGTIPGHKEVYGYTVYDIRTMQDRVFISVS